jgi:hypothetical protein
MDSLILSKQSCDAAEASLIPVSLFRSVAQTEIMEYGLYIVSISSKEVPARFRKSLREERVDFVTGDLVGSLMGYVFDRVAS